MKFKAMFKKAIITASAIAVLAAGTIASAYAAVYDVGIVYNFSCSATGTNSFSSSNDVFGTVVDQTGTYITIFNNKSYSDGTSYIYSYTDHDKHGEGSYYFYNTNAAPISRNYENVPAGSNYHYWKNTGGGGFRTNIQTYLYS
ncbi:MAG: hypothetical protein ACI4F2_06215 [Acutalibacteraceae bacterium]